MTIKPIGRKSVLVTDGNHRATLAVVRSLGRAGIPVTVGDSGGSAVAARSRYCSSRVLYPSPLKSPADFKSFIREQASTGQYSLLLPMTDITLQCMAEDSAQLRGCVALPFPQLEQVKIAQDKAQTLALAASLGIASPRTITGCSQTAVERALRELSFPVVLKPRISRVWRAGAWAYGRVSYAENPEDLRRKFEAAHADIPEPLIQEKIEGEGRGVFLLVWNGELKAAFSHRRLREKPPSGGVSVYCESVALDPVLLDKSYALLRAIGWQGPAMVEFKLDRRDGQAKLMEINGRFWGSLQLAIDAGVDFPLMLYRLAIGEDVRFSPEYRVGVKSRWLRGDFDHLLMRLRMPREEHRQLFPNSSKLSAVLAFLKFYDRDLHYADVHLDDLGPFAEECRQYARSVFSRMSPKQRTAATNQAEISTHAIGKPAA